MITVVLQLLPLLFLMMMKIEVIKRCSGSIVVVIVRMVMILTIKNKKKCVSTTATATTNDKNH